MENSIEQQIENMKKVVSYLNARLNFLETALENALGIVPEVAKPEKKANPNKSSKISDDERAELIAGIPYTKEQIDKFNRKQLTVLAGAAKVQIFGTKTEELKKNLLDKFSKMKPKTDTKKDNGKK